MIPIRLTIEGLYSYQDRQTIDFDHLVEAGLFGIFGPVGSGKSSILEAITFALYGETERLNAREKRPYNMMNLKSNRAYIEFDFLNFENRVFRSSREFRRNSKNFDDVKIASVVLYEYKDNQWIPLETTNVGHVIGLSYENFKRTIIIPQGQFKEFIELGSADRTRMMKEIFRLHRFDLQDKVTKLSNENKSSLDQFNGRLLGYEEVSPEAVAQQQETYNLAKQQLKELEDELSRINERFQFLKSLKDSADELAKYKEQFAQISVQKEDMQALKNQLSQYETVHQAFYQLLIDRKKLIKDIDQHTAERVVQQQEHTTLSQKNDDLLVKQQEINAQYEQLDAKKGKLKDLELIQTIKSLSERLAQKQHQLDIDKKLIEDKISSTKDLEQDIYTEQQELDIRKAQKFNSGELMEVAQWFTEAEVLQNKKEQDRILLLNIQQELDKILSQMGELEIGQDGIDQDIRSLEEQRRQLSDKKSHLDVQQKLAEYAHALHDEVPCPLCGSTTHPHIAEYQDISHELRDISESLQTTEDTIKTVQQRWSVYQTLSERHKLFEEQLVRTNLSLSSLETQIQTHLSGFTWASFSAHDFDGFDTKRKESLQVEKDIQRLESKLSELRQRRETARADLEKEQQAYSQSQIELHQIVAQIDSSKSYLQVSDPSEYVHISSQQIKDQYLHLQEYITATEAIYRQINEDVQTIQKSLIALHSQIQSGTRYIDNITAELNILQNNIRDALARHNFGDIEEVRTILAKQIDVHHTRTILEAYNIRYESLRTTISALEDKLKDVQFNEEEYTALAHQLPEIAQKVKSGTENTARAETKLSGLKQQQREKEELLTQQIALTKRSDNLKIMTRLFKGSGFVEYVSSIYLRQLCDHANVRFHRMTRNQLSLTVNENNDFEIIDYLNEGKSRSVKTLSGGQSFQVSLSLALALAESVQSNAMASKNFFFIDEGFGTQDSESINIVFETLVALQRENRIVGIISHVEELKERIPASLSISKDEERGSTIIVDK